MLSIVYLALVITVGARNLFAPKPGSSLTTWRTSAIPSSFQWTSTPPLVTTKNDSHTVAGIKDPSVIFYEDTYHVFASTAQASGYNLVYFNFTDFNQAGAAPFYYLDQSGIGTGYRAAPEVFYFEPQKLWYLIFQNGNAAYSTNEDISNPAGWSAPTNFYSGTPTLIQDGLEGGYWVDMWVICDSANCHLFSSDDNGRLYRSQTTLSDFPNNMSDPVIALQETSKYDLYEASNVYSTDNGTYLLLVECIGNGTSAGGQRYFRSWTSTDIAGPWAPLAATQSNPFMGEANVHWNGTQWTKSISHGELVRTVLDQRLRISTCGMRYMYQGVDPTANTEYNALPWKLGLLTQTSTC